MAFLIMSRRRGGIFSWNPPISQTKQRISTVSTSQPTKHGPKAPMIRKGPSATPSTGRSPTHLAQRCAFRMSLSANRKSQPVPEAAHFSHAQGPHTARADLCVATAMSFGDVKDTQVSASFSTCWHRFHADPQPRGPMGLHCHLRDDPCLGAGVLFGLHLARAGDHHVVHAQQLELIGHRPDQRRRGRAPRRHKRFHTNDRCYPSRPGSAGLAENNAILLPCGSRIYPT